MMLKSIHREIVLTLRQPRFLLNACLFFAMMVVFFPLTLPANPLLIKQMAAGIIWMALLLSLLLISERFFQADFEEGLLEQWALSDCLIAIVASKLIVWWICILIPLLVFSPFLILLFGLTGWDLILLWTSLIAGTPALVGLAMLAAAFGLSRQQKGVFMALILLPLTVPIMIFGSSILTSGFEGLAVSGQLAFLLAFSLLTISFLPFVIAAVIRISLAE